MPASDVIAHAKEFASRQPTVIPDSKHFIANGFAQFITQAGSLATQ